MIQEILVEADSEKEAIASADRGRTVAINVFEAAKPSSAAPSGNLVANAAGAAFRLGKAAVLGHQIVSSKEEIDRRLSICRACEFFQPSGMRCLKCGCFLNLKTRLETEHCPIAKW
jgi:hypothetical protein